MTDQPMTATITPEKIERIELMLYEIGGGKTWGYDRGTARRDAEYILTILAGDETKPKGVTVTMPAEMSDAYVALQRAVDDAMHPREIDGSVLYDYPYPHGRSNIAAACLSVKKTNEQ